MTTTRKSTEEWHKIVSEQRESGLSQRAWCTENGINRYTFRDRASKLRKLGIITGATTQTSAETASWVELRVEEVPEDVSKTGGSVNIERGGFVIVTKVGFDSDHLTEILRAVNRACC